ncbi:hypothetical protein MMC19_007376 [Ptychographa xylographoides]|nr:hypothetical protein [Ptychographa xylographoides]
MASIPSAYDSSASAVKFSSLQYAEEEIKIPIVNFDDPEVQRVAAKFTPEQRAWFMSRDKALEQLLWGKFEKKIQARGLYEEWADQVVIPSTLGPNASPQQFESAGVGFLQRKAPDLVDEFIAQKEWQREQKKRRDVMMDGK